MTDLHACLVVLLQMPVLPRDMGTFHCSLPRLMPLTAIDPSLAIGFYCADSGGRQRQQASSLGAVAWRGCGCAVPPLAAACCWQLEGCRLRQHHTHIGPRSVLFDAWTGSQQPVSIA